MHYLLILIQSPEEHLSRPQKRILDMPKSKMSPNLRDGTTSTTRRRVSGEVSHLISHPTFHGVKSDHELWTAAPLHPAVPASAFDFRTRMTVYADYLCPLLLGLDAHACSRDIEVRYHLLTAA